MPENPRIYSFCTSRWALKAYLQGSHTFQKLVETPRGKIVNDLKDSWNLPHDNSPQNNFLLCVSLPYKYTRKCEWNIYKKHNQA